MFLLPVFLPILGIWDTICGYFIIPSDDSHQNDFYAREIRFVSALKSRLTGSHNHTIFINYLDSELKNLGLNVFSDNFEFDYNAPPSSPLSLTVNGRYLSPAGYVPYSGNTDERGSSGDLVQVSLPPGTASPDWNLAAGNIALINLFNTPVDGSLRYPVWSGSPPWGEVANLGAMNPGIRNLTAAAAAGVKGVIYNWQNMSDANAFGQYGPFKVNYQGIPAIYVTDQAMRSARAQNGSAITIKSTGKLFSHRKTRTLYTIVEGTDLKQESIIISTHSDGTNSVEENGHIALLAKARALARSPPRRTTILVFLTGHLHTSGFTTTGRMMERWLHDHLELWAGSSSASLKAVFGSCVEHLGALHWKEDLANNRYLPSGQVEEELLFASTPQLAALLGKLWRGAVPEILRVGNPNLGPAEQPGEGLPFSWNDIPSISLVTAPDWLLKVFPPGFDESRLMDAAALKRQVESFLRVWDAIDKMTADEIGTLNYLP